MSDDDFLDGIGESVPLEGRRVVQPQPWHKPRKHYVRRFQWEALIARLLDDLERPTAEFRYLTLPGPELLDVRHLYKAVCAPRELSLKYLGFDRSAAPTSPEQASFENTHYSVRGLPLVDNLSDVLPDDFALIGDLGQPAHKAAESYGPYHAINIDLCDGFARSDTSPTMFNAVRNLLHLQSQTPDPSLLFITTRINSDQVTPTHRSQLQSLFLHELRHSAYSDELRSHFGASTAFLSPATALATPPDLRLVLELMNWLIIEALNVNMSAELASTLVYDVGGKGPDMASIAVRLRRLKKSPVVAHGLAKNDALDAETEESRWLRRVPNRLSKFRNVDETLEADDSLRDTISGESRRLLDETGLTFS